MTTFPLLENVTFREVKDLQLGAGGESQDLQYYEHDISV